MIFEEVINTRNWSILKIIAFPLKKKIEERLDSDIYTIATHIQRYDETSPKGRPIHEKILNVTICTKISINIERDFDYILNAKYLEYDVYKFSDIILSFRLYFDLDVISFPYLNKEFVYSIQMPEREMEKIADNIISMLNIIEYQRI